MEFYATMEEFHIHMLQERGICEEFQLAERRYKEASLVLEQTLDGESDLDFRDKLQTLRKPLKLAAHALSKARAAVVQISAIQEGSGVRHYATRMGRNQASRRTVQFDGFMTRLQVYDGVSRMYQTYLKRRLHETREITSGVLIKMAAIIQQRLVLMD